MNLSDLLIDGSLVESISDSTEVCEISIELDPNDPKIAKDGVIIDQKLKRCYGLRSTLLKWAKKSHPHSSPVYLSAKIQPTKNYVIKTYQCDVVKRELQDAQQHFNEEQYKFTFIDIKPYPKRVNHTTVTLILPENYDDKDLSNKIMKNKKDWDRENQKLIYHYVTFFEDSDAKSDFNLEDLPEFKTMEKKFRDITNPDLKKKQTYRFVVDPEYEKYGKFTELKLIIHGNGYVRKDDGNKVDMIFSPTGDTFEERITAAWKFAVQWCKKKKLM